MITIQYTTVDRIFAKVNRDFGQTISESDMIEWIGEALEAINVPRLYQEAVAFVEVKNFTCCLPNFLFQINQIARDTQYDGHKSTKLCSDDILESKLNCFENENIPNPCVDCIDIKQDDYANPCACMIPDCGAYYIDEIFDTYWVHRSWQESDLYHQRFVPVRLSTKSFFGDFPNVGYYKNIGDKGWKDEYSYATQNTLKFSFEKGTVAISYLKYKVDEKTGYPIIPDHEIYTTAITSYILYKYCCREFYMGRDGAAQKMQKAEMDWQWYCKRAGSQAMMPSLDDMQNLLDQQYRMIPAQKSYDGFFGKLNFRTR